MRKIHRLVLAMIFDLLRKITLHTKLVKSMKWERHVGNLLYGKTVGIIGTGRIGKRVSEVLALLGANVIACDTYPDNKWAEASRIRYTSQENLLKESDIISLHVSPTGNDKTLINAIEVDQMKSGVIFINTSRGQFVDESALYAGLLSQKIAGLGLDVYVNEPYFGELIKFDSVVLTPHIATLTKESRLEMEVEATRNVLDFLAI